MLHKQYLCRYFFVLLTACVLSTGHAGAQEEVFATWTSFTLSDATFDLDGDMGSVFVTGEVNWDGGFKNITTLDGATNYPDVWFTPMPPAGADFLVTTAGNMTSGTVGSADVVVTFAQPVTDPKFHFVNLDNGTVDFAPTTDVASDPVVLTQLSGNPELEVTGTLLNATPRSANRNGCENAAGDNPNGGCGTVQLSGTYSSVTFELIDTNTSLGAGDGFQWTLSVPAQATPVVDVPTLDVVGLLVLALLAMAAALSRLRPH